MVGKFFLGKYLIWVILLLGQLHGYKSCVQKERKALLELKKYIISITEEVHSDYVLPTWTYDTEDDCCRWEGIKCNHTSKQVTEIASGTLFLRENSLLNLSLLHPFEDVRSLNLSRNEEFNGFYHQFDGLFDDVEDFKSLGRLRNLEILDLSYNNFNSSIFPFLKSATSVTTLFLRNNDFTVTPFPAKELTDLTNLEMLDLSENGFNDSIPVQELSALRKLKSLDLRSNLFTAPTGSQGYKSLGRLRNLEVLDLSLNLFNNSIIPFLSAATSLKSLFLGSNRMDGPFPTEELKDLTNLELLDLSENKFNGSIPIRELSTLRKLKALDLSDNEFSGSIELQGIFEMKNMQELDLSRNRLVGKFPLSLTRLTKLRSLDLSSNQLTGSVPSSLGNLVSLKYLSLFSNNFEGVFSLGSLANLSELRVFKLGSKSKSLQLQSSSYWKPKFQLSVIELPSCNLIKVPYFLLYQKDLRQIDLSDNKISGVFPHWLLAKNRQLKVLFLHNNRFTSFQLPISPHSLLFLDVSVNEFSHLLPKNIGWIFPRLRYMKLANNRFQGNLPSSLGKMKRIRYLNISHNSFHGKLPRSFVMGCYSMEVLTLSNNKLNGEVFWESLNFTNVFQMSMDNNQFTGSIGPSLRSLENLGFLDISNNSLTGVLPSWIGQISSLNALLLSNNSLEGEIPISLFNKTYLKLLDLSANILSGGIPPHANWEFPIVLLLQDNNLSGEISDTLLTSVSILDLRNNKLSGNIPEFTNTQNTYTLLLGGNNLTGSIPSQLCGLRKIQLLDLSNNRLNGSIPSCFSNTSFVFVKNQTLYDEDNYGHYFMYGSLVFSSYDQDLSLQKDFATDTYGIHFKSLIDLDIFRVTYSPIIPIKIEFATKHRYDAYWGGNLKLLFGMDLSENELSGEIPAELGGLLELQGLNLSHNKLSGAIPQSFSGLKNVESLDLSFNRLQGHIPPQLTELSSLAVFNVSFNNLSGVVPQGKQFNTFDSQSFLGNPLLCGQQINRSCDNSSNFQEQDNGVKDNESQIDMVSFYWSSAAAYATVLLGIFSSLTFESPWSRFWFYLIDAFIYKAKKNLFW